MLFLKYAIKSLVSRSFSFFLHRNQSLTSISLNLWPAAAWTVLILAVHVGRELHTWNQIFFYLSTLVKNSLFFLGVKLSLPGHGDPLNVFFFNFVCHFVLRSLFSPSLCVFNQHIWAPQPCSWWELSMSASRGTQINLCLHTWVFLCIQQKYNLAAVIIHHRKYW